MAESNIRTVLRELVEWSKGLPLWQRDALRRIYRKLKLLDNDIVELLNICKAQHDLLGDKDTAPEPAPVDTLHLPSEKITSTPVVLRAIKDVKHVNALAPNQSLSFREKGLTVVFGNNASGKSGYARILKKVCRTRLDEDILPNVYKEETKEPASASIYYSLSGTQYKFEWQDGKTPQEILSYVSVFDSKCASVYIENQVEAAYIPTPLQMLQELAKACLTLKDRLQKEQQALRKDVPAWLREPKYHPGTAVANLLEGLSGDTKFKAVQALATLSEDEKKRHEQLKTQFATDPLKLAKQEELKKDRIKRILEIVKTLATSLSDEKLEEYKKAMSDAEIKAKAARIAASDLFKDDPLPHIGSETWRNLWEAARNYSKMEAYPDKAFPNTDSDAVCVLCQQPFSPKAAERMKRFEKFIKDDTQRKADLATAELRKRKKALEELPVEGSQLREIIALIQNEFNETELAKKLCRFFRRAVVRRSRVLKVSNMNEWPELVELPPAPVEQLDSLLKDLQSRIDELYSISNSEERRKLEKEFNELEDRVWLASIIEEIKDEISRKKILMRYENAISDTDTNRVTRKSSQVAEQLITKVWRDRFAWEVSQLNLHHLRIELVQEKGKYGTAQFRIVLMRNNSAPVGQVLSEGEYHCVALAAFLSELAISDNNSGIVFDDPVSSLDHEFREAVAKRLSREAETRQVIVFTHDIAFLMSLYEGTKSNVETKFISVHRGAEVAGVVDKSLPFNAQPVLEAIAHIERYLNQTKSLYNDGRINEWEEKVDSMSMRLRKCWERAVELVLSPVLYRYSNKVDTKGLVKVSVLTEEDCKKMREAYKRCSKLHHSESIEGVSNIIEPSKIQDEINILREWIKDIETRQKAIKL